MHAESVRDLVVDAAYVGNRGAWWVAPLEAPIRQQTVGQGSVQLPPPKKS